MQENLPDVDDLFKQLDQICEELQRFAFKKRGIPKAISVPRFMKSVRSEITGEESILTKRLIKYDIDYLKMLVNKLEFSCQSQQTEFIPILGNVFKIGLFPLLMTLAAFFISYIKGGLNKNFEFILYFLSMYGVLAYIVLYTSATFSRITHLVFLVKQAIFIKEKLVAAGNKPVDCGLKEL